MTRITNIRMVKYLNILHTVAMMHPVHIFRLFSTRIQVTGHQLPQVTWGHSWGKKWQPDCENQKKFSSQKDVKKLASPFDLKDYVLFLFFFCLKSKQKSQQQQVLKQTRQQ